jgi:cyclopropane fatty-acyl-phospholipid synthase-like methyltransferase
MADGSHQTTATWQDDAFARSWAQQDQWRDMLEFPRRIAASVVHDDNPGLGLITDIGSGPGDFLAVFLEEFPAARGLWTDVSDTMRELAEERLAAFGDRVEFQAVDMTDLAGLPNGADAVTTSRATHHLDRAGLLDFYAQAASHLAPGGWLINLDHIGPDDRWNTRLRTVRKRFRASAESGPAHHHNYPLPSVQDHLDGFAAAGITDVQVVWRAFFTCLFMGRREG